MEFQLSGAREKLTKEKTEELMKPLREKPENWKKIKLSGKSFDVESAQVVAEIIPSLVNLEVADLSDIIAGRGEEEAHLALKLICSSFRELKVKEIDLSENALGKKGVQVCETLLSKTESVEGVSLNNDGLDQEAAKTLLSFLLPPSSSPSSSSPLKKLHLFNNLLKDGGAEAISLLLSSSPKMQDFRFSSTRIEKEGITFLSSSLSSSTSSLTSLDLSDNSISPKGFSLL